MEATSTGVSAVSERREIENGGGQLPAPGTEDGLSAEGRLRSAQVEGLPCHRRVHLQDAQGRGGFPGRHPRL